MLSGPASMYRVSHHRYHHLHTDTPLDPHSPYEGFWWAHITWLFNTEVWLLDHVNVRDLTSQTFYRYGRQLAASFNHYTNHQSWIAHKWWSSMACCCACKGLKVTAQCA